MVTPGQRLEHAQHVSSLKIYFLSRLTAVASRILKSLTFASVSRGKLALEKQPTFRDATTGFPREMTSEKRAQKFHSDDVSPPGLAGFAASR